MEMLFGFFDGSGKGIIVSFASNGALNVVSAVARAGKNASEDVAGGAQQIARDSGHRSLEARHKSVAAFVAMKAELIAAICRKIVEIGGEAN